MWSSAKSVPVAIVLLLSAVYCATALTCYECDSSAGDASCMDNVVKDSWLTTECSTRIPELEFDIHPKAVRCVHMTYVEDNKLQLERKCGFQGLCELLLGLNDIHILGNVTDIHCHTCNSAKCNLVGNPRQIVFRNTNNL